MKIKHLLLIVTGAVMLLSSCEQSISGSSKMESDIDSLSYMLGVDVGNSLKGAAFEEITYKLFMNGLMDAFEEKDLQVDEKEIKPYINKYMMGLREKQAKMAEEKGIINLDEGRVFLEENKKREGVITTESGLQYEIIREGNGKSPVATDVVKCHYQGTLLDGTVFDTTVDKDPRDFPLNRVIPGWTEGVQLMKEGAKYKFYIPTELAYGANVRPGSPYEANMALIFEIELLEVNPEQKEN